MHILPVQLLPFWRDQGLGGGLGGVYRSVGKTPFLAPDLLRVKKLRGETAALSCNKNIHIAV